MLDLTTPEGITDAEEKAARLCGIEMSRMGCANGKYEARPDRWEWWPPRFLAGLLPDGTCNEAQVDGDKLKLVLFSMRQAALGVAGPRLEYVPIFGLWCCVVWTPTERIMRDHAHPVAALLLAADDAGMLEKGDAS